MRSVLVQIPLDGTLDLGPLGRVPVFGLGLLLALWALLGLAIFAQHWRQTRKWRIEFTPLIAWAAVALALFKAGDPNLPFRNIPIYGYGTMLFVGFLVASTFASRRLRKEGASGDLAWDMAMWLFLSGIIGGRTYYVATHPAQFFGPDPKTGQPRTVWQILVALVNLPDGGLVLYGALILAPLAYVLFCRRRRISALAFGDIAITSVFIGLLFGRLGCLLHGCCYGDVCSLPWAVQFPKGSVPFDALVLRGYLADDQPRSLPLHPTQIYDALNALLLALLTYFYYPCRRRAGEVLALGWMLYPVNRFLIEFLRFDEPPVFGTPLTGAQWVSVALFLTGAAFFAWLQTRPIGGRLAR
ncbi:MAG: prolipoprotein diacylglyceryl transferase [Planctomycetaceae bacterium]